MCATCLRHDNAREDLIPIIGMVCGDCRRKLEEPNLPVDLLAASLGVDLGRAAVEKFNEVSERVGFPDRLPCEKPAEGANDG